MQAPHCLTPGPCHRPQRDSVPISITWFKVKPPQKRQDPKWQESRVFCLHGSSNSFRQAHPREGLGDSCAPFSPVLREQPAERGDGEETRRSPELGEPEACPEAWPEMRLTLGNPTAFLWARHRGRGSAGLAWGQTCHARWSSAADFGCVICHLGKGK